MNIFKKPDYVPWKLYLRWLILPKKYKIKLEERIAILKLLHCLVRNHPEAIEKINTKQSCSWTLSKEDRDDAIKTINDFLKK